MLESPYASSLAIRVTLFCQMLSFVGQDRNAGNEGASVYSGRFASVALVLILTSSFRFRMYDEGESYFEGVWSLLYVNPKYILEVLIKSSLCFFILGIILTFFYAFVKVCFLHDVVGNLHSRCSSYHSCTLGSITVSALCILYSSKTL